MFVGDLEKIIAIEFFQGGRHLREDELDDLAPPAFVVVFARAVDRFARGHLFPGGDKSAIQLGHPQVQADLATDEGVVMADAVGEKEEGADGIEEDGLWSRHAANVQRSTPNVQRPMYKRELFSVGQHARLGRGFWRLAKTIFRKFAN